MPLLRRGTCAERLSIWGCLRFARPIPQRADLNRGEIYYPLHVYVCEQCFLVQLEEYESAEKSSATTHISPPTRTPGSSTAENYCDKMTKRFGLNEKSFVVEVASNDGYLLQYFVAAQRAGAGH